eukprot:bmy_12105T0
MSPSTAQELTAEAMGTVQNAPSGAAGFRGTVGTASFVRDVKVFSEDGTSKVVEILADTTARDLCQLLVYRSHCVDDNSWTLVEHHPHLGLERCLEDHELVVQVESTMASESKFLFRKNYAKYEFFKNPTVSLVSLSLGFGTLEILQFILEFHSSGSQNN